MMTTTSTTTTVSNKRVEGKKRKSCDVDCLPVTRITTRFFSLSLSLARSLSSVLIMNRRRKARGGEETTKNNEDRENEK